MGRFWTDYTWDVAAGLPVVLQETYREKTQMPQETRSVKTYVYGLDLISVYTDDPEHGTSAQDYYFTDGLGSTVTLARDPPGEIANWTYDAFGEVRTKSGPLSTDFLFTGEQFDAKARPAQGLYYPARPLLRPEHWEVLNAGPALGLGRSAEVPEPVPVRWVQPDQSNRSHGPGHDRKRNWKWRDQGELRFCRRSAPSGQCKEPRVPRRRARARARAPSQAVPPRRGLPAHRGRGNGVHGKGLHRPEWGTQRFAGGLGHGHDSPVQRMRAGGCDDNAGYCLPGRCRHRS